MRNTPRMCHSTDVLAARFQFGLFRLLLRRQRRGAGKLGGLRGFFLGGELLGFFPLLAFEALFMEFMPYPCLVRKLLVVLAGTDLALGKTVKLHQGDMARADIAARAAFDAVEQAERLRPAEFPGLREPVQVLRLQIRRAHFDAARAADARHGGRRRRE